MNFRLKFWIVVAVVVAGIAISGVASAGSVQVKGQSDVKAVVKTIGAAKSRPRHADELLKRLSDALTRRIDNDPDAILAASRVAGAERFKRMRIKIDSVPSDLNSIGARMVVPDAQTETTLNPLDGE